MALLLLIAILGVLWYIYYRCKNSHLFELGGKIPGPPTLPLVGNALTISLYPGGVLHYLNDYSNKYGSVTRHWIGTLLTVYLSDANDIEIILRDVQNLKKPNTYEFLENWLGQGLVTSTGEHWHSHRKAVTSAFHSNNLEKFMEILNEKCKIMLRRLHEKANNEIFNIMPFVTSYNLDAVLETAMGAQLNAQIGAEPQYVTFLNSLQQLILTRIFNPLLRTDWIFPFTNNGREQVKAVKFLNGYCKKLISEKKRIYEETDVSISGDNDKNKRLSFMDILLSDQHKGTGLTDIEILEELNTIVASSHETTSTAISFAIYCLAQNQDIQNKIYQEIVDLYGFEKSDLTLKDMQKTQYLDMVVKEVLRMYPPIPMYSRLLESDLQLSKYLLPSGTSLTCFAYAVHRNKKYYSNPDVFDPEHFSPENSKSRHPCAFIPFSGGLRNCIGQQFAMVEIKLTLVELVKHFRILPGLDLKEIKSYLILEPTNGINIRLERRKL